MAANVDPALEEQLAAAEKSTPVRALVGMSEGRSEDDVVRLLEDLRQATGDCPTTYRYLDQLSVLSLTATPGLLRELIKSPGVVTVAAVDAEIGP